MRDNQESLRLLEEYHQFPGEYTFKIIGPNSHAWFAMVKQAAESVLGNIGDCLQTSASSSSQRYQSLSLCVHVADAAKVLEVYAALKKVPDVKMLL